MSFASWWFNKIIGVDGKLVSTITWTNGLVTTAVTGTNSLSAKFKTAEEDVMVIDSADAIFSTNNDMIVNSITIRSTDVNGVSFELGYGLTVDSITSWKNLGEGTFTGFSTMALPRRMFIPKGNYLTLHRVSGTDDVRFSGAISISQTVVADSNLNDDMEGNSP